MPRDSILEFKALPEYHEPDWVTEKFVKAGKLPPVEERLPKEPLVFKTGNMPDGIGVYGDTMRHVIGGRPEGWNYIAGQTQGWGGIDIGLSECLTRTGPLFQVEAEDVEPLPNLAKSWEWSEDGHQLTMHLIEGAKWSDGDPFNAEDVMFYWEDNVVDPNVSPLNGATPETFGEGTTLKAIDDYTIDWTFKDAFPQPVSLRDGLRQLLPGAGAHPEAAASEVQQGTTYDQYKNAFPPEYMNFPVMGAWVPVDYRPDDIIVMRRNPYYWKVDEQGNQLPYLDEMHYKLSTWADRDVQAVAGSGDFSNLEQPENFVESLKRAADRDAPARLAFGAAPDRLQSAHELLGQRLGRTRRARPGRSASSTATSTSARRSPWRSTASSSANRWSRARSRRSIRAASRRARASTTGNRRSTIRSISKAPRRCSKRPV